MTVGTNFVFQGGATVYLYGAVDLPLAAVTYQGGSGSNSPCEQLIANTVNFNGSATFSSNCSGSGTKTIGGTPVVTLVE